MKLTKAVDNIDALAGVTWHVPGSRPLAIHGPHPSLSFRLTEA
jgi:hypothetical protein